MSITKGGPKHVFFGEREIRCHHCGARETVFPIPLSKKRIAAFTLTCEAFSEEHKKCEPGAPQAMTPAAWLDGPDTGTSSKTIFAVMTGRVLSNDFRPATPRDPADFGRCHRLLALFPEWRTRLGEVAAKHPEWAPLVAVWPELETLFEEESPSGKAPRLYARMRMLLWGEAP